MTQRILFRTISAPLITGFLFFAGLTFHSASWSAESDSELGYIPEEVARSAAIPREEHSHEHSHKSFFAKSPNTQLISDGQRMEKFEQLLLALGIPLEDRPNFSGLPSPFLAAQSEVLEMLKFIDPDNGFRRYLDLSFDSVSLFRDFFSHILPYSFLEFRYPLKTEGESLDSPELISRISSVIQRNQLAFQYFINPHYQLIPLAGLKVLIDPGHMGGNIWDTRTGKFVKSRGYKVSEGDLNLWTSILLAQELAALGADVRLTRDSQNPVAQESFETFNDAPFRHDYFYNGVDDWIGQYLHLSSSEIISAVKKDPKYERAYSEKGRTDFFVTGADLLARTQQMDEFKPDVTIDIHYDASENYKLQNSYNDVEAYVPGSFRMNEVGSRKNKAFAFEHLLEARRWKESVELASQVTQSMSRELNLPLLKTPQFLSGIKVKDGVYARNLFITRRALNGLVIYLECLHYDNVHEFARMTKRTKKGHYKGVNFSYPARVDEVVQGIKKGLLNYFGAQPTTPVAN